MRRISLCCLDPRTPRHSTGIRCGAVTMETVSGTRGTRQCKRHRSWRQMDLSSNPSFTAFCKALPALGPAFRSVKRGQPHPSCRLLLEGSTRTQMEHLAGARCRKHAPCEAMVVVGVGINGTLDHDLVCLPGLEAPYRKTRHLVSLDARNAQNRRGHALGSQYFPAACPAPQLTNNIGPSRFAAFAGGAI